MMLYGGTQCVVVPIGEYYFCIYATSTWARLVPQKGSNFIQFYHEENINEFSRKEKSNLVKSLFNFERGWE